MQGMQPGKSREGFLLESVSLLRSLQWCKAHSPWPALRTQSRGTGLCPLGLRQSFPTCPSPTRTKQFLLPLGPGEPVRDAGPSTPCCIKPAGRDQSTLLPTLKPHQGAGDGQGLLPRAPDWTVAERMTVVRKLSATLVFWFPPGHAVNNAGALSQQPSEPKDALPKSHQTTNAPNKAVTMPSLTHQTFMKRPLDLGTEALKTGPAPSSRD